MPSQLFAARKVPLSPEILGQILKDLSTDDHVRIARVSNFWCDVAVGFIWKQIEDIQVLLRLLAPLAVKDGKVAFARPLTAQDWARFDYYAPRVYELGLRNFSNDSPSVLHPSLMKVISTTRSPSKFLPNLQRLQLNPSTLDRAGILLHPTITSLHIVWLQSDSHFVSPLLSSLHTTTPRLEELFLNDGGSRAPDVSVERILAAAVQKLPSLNLLYLPTWWPTSAIFRAAATCPRLSELYVSWAPFNTGEVDISNFEHLFSTSLPPGGFPSLSVFDAPMPFPRAVRIISQQGCFDIISRLAIESPHIEGRREYGALLDTLSNCCPNLEDLSLDVGHLQRQTTEGVTFNELSPIMRFKGLEALNLQHTMPFQLVAEEVVTMVRALPKLTYITLNSSPDFESATTLNVSVLASLYKLRPNIDMLGLYLDASAERIPPPASDDEYVPASLRPVGSPDSVEVNLSVSYLTAPIPLAMYLSRVLPPSWYLEISPRRNDEGGRILENWQQVKQLIPAFRRVREEAYELGVRRGERRDVLRHPLD